MDDAATLELQDLLKGAFPQCYAPQRPAALAPRTHCMAGCVRCGLTAARAVLVRSRRRAGGGAHGQVGRA